MTEPGYDKALAAWKDEAYWCRLSEVLRAENAALKDAVRVLCGLVDEMRKDGHLDSARGVLLHSRVEPFLAAVEYLRRLAVHG